MMGTPQPESLDRLSSAIVALRDTLNELEVPHTFIGGVALAATGRPRMTHDVDVLVMLGETSLRSLLEKAKRHGIMPRISNAESFAAKHRVLLLLHKQSAIPIEVSLGLLPFEEEAIARSQEIHIEGIRFKAPSAEDLIVMKAVAHRPQDMEDIRNIAAMNPRLDRERVIRWLTEFAEALEAPDLVAEVEHLLGQA